jgi:hypothetical protein
MKLKNKGGTKSATIPSLLMLSSGVLMISASTFLVSSILAVIGAAILFWSVILIYITPTKEIPLELLNNVITSSASNIERILIEENFEAKGLYLPPRLLEDAESSLVIIPKHHGQPLPKSVPTNKEKVIHQGNDFLVITPPGLGLCRLFEKVTGVSFTRTSLSFVEKVLPKIIVADLELAERVKVEISENSVQLEIIGNVLKETFQERRELIRTNTQVGCFFSSAIACVLAKASGRVVIIQRDEGEGDKTRIKYQIEGE